jgi:hypothetical protein
MRVPHKHMALIREWALDTKKTIQWYCEDQDEWVDCIGDCPNWDTDLQFRCKPDPAKDITTSCKITRCYGAIMWNSTTDHVPYANLKLTFDGATGSLKHAEVLK